MTRIRIKRVYEPESPDDGYRVLVDRLWPRGIRKDALHYDSWEKEVAPSAALRTWYHQDPAGRWDEFRKRYLSDLEHSGTAAAFAGKIRERRRKPRAHPPGIPRNHPRITPSGRSVPPRRSPPVLSANGSGPSLRQKTTNRQLSHISKDSQHPHCGYSQNIGLPTTGTIKNNLSKKSYGGSALHARTAPIPRRSPVFLGFFCVFTKYPYLRSAVCDVQNRGSTIALCTGDKQDALQTKVFISVTVAFSERSR